MNSVAKLTQKSYIVANSQIFIKKLFSSKGTNVVLHGKNVIAISFAISEIMKISMYKVAKVFQCNFLRAMDKSCPKCQAFASMHCQKLIFICKCAPMLITLTYMVYKGCGVITLGFCQKDCVLVNQVMPL